MTTSTHSAALPEWPTIKFLRGTSMGADLIYERQRADAAMARLELAVEALKQMSGMVHSIQQSDIDATLTAIGDLPHE